MSQVEYPEFLLELRKAEVLRGGNTEDNLKQAREICSSLVRRFPNYFRALLTLGLIDVSLRSYNTALESLVRAVILNPNSWEANLALGSLLLAIKSPDAAKSFICKAHNLQPNNSSTLTCLAEFFLRKENYTKTIECSYKALSLSAHSIEACFLLIKAFNSTGNYKKASDLISEMEVNSSNLLELTTELMKLPASIAKPHFLEISESLLTKLSTVSSNHRITASYANAHKLHHEARYSEAFDLLSEVNNEIFTKTSKEYSALVSRQLGALAEVGRVPVKIKHEGLPKADGNKLLLILGPSRCGKSTVEQLLGRDSRVTLGYESSIIEDSCKEVLNNAGLLQSVLVEAIPSKLESEFVAIINSRMSDLLNGKEILTVTNPIRIFDAYRLLSIRPNTFAVFVERDLVDNAMRILMTRYLQGNSYSYNIETTVRYIKWYREMCGKINYCFPNNSYVIKLENIVNNTTNEISNIWKMLQMPVNSELYQNVEMDHDIGYGAPYRFLFERAGINN